MEHDPTATDGEPDEIAEPSEPVEATVPPPGYEPQPELGSDQNPGVTERDSVTIEETETEVNDANPKDGVADDNDDDAEDGD